MAITPIGSAGSSIQWSTLRTDAVNMVRSPAPTPTASIEETARVEVNQMSPMLAVGASLGPDFSSIKIGQSPIAVMPVLGTSSWGF
jgi:hypothetical protein